MFNSGRWSPGSHQQRFVSHVVNLYLKYVYNITSNIKRHIPCTFIYDIFSQTWYFSSRRPLRGFAEDRDYASCVVWCRRRGETRWCYCCTNWGYSNITAQFKLQQATIGCATCWSPVKGQKATIYIYRVGNTECLMIIFLQSFNVIYIFSLSKLNGISQAAR